MQTPFPAVSEDLIKQLEEVFPMKDFGFSDSQRFLDFHFGQRSVIAFLKAKHAEQTNNILKME
jgi:hypothetical protein